MLIAFNLSLGFFMEGFPKFLTLHSVGAWLFVGLPKHLERMGLGRPRA